jgi:hypothetical protein
MNQIMTTYGLMSDIIYNDTEFSFEGKYTTIYCWNSSKI